MIVEKKITDDFDLKLIADSGQCFRWEEEDNGSYRIIHGNDCLYISPGEKNVYFFEMDEKGNGTDWDNYLDLGENYRKIRRRIDGEKDPFLKVAAKEQKGIRILRQDPWEMLITFIISQNKNIPGIRRCVEKLCEMSGKKLKDIRGKTYYGFPSPKAILDLEEGDLVSCSLGYRCAYVTAAAKAVEGGEIDLDALRDADEEETLDKLISIHGVGKKVASCISLFGLHHIDAFPIDVWIKRILEQEYPDGYPYEEYSPYNGVYQQYMFAYYRKHYG